jgi:integrase
MGTEYKLGRLKGRFVVTWREDGRRRRYRLGKGISKSEAELQRVRFLKSRERLNAREATTVGELFAAYLKDREIDGKSIEKQRHSWKALAPAFGALSPSDITKTTCREFSSGRVACGRSLGTSWTELSVLRASLSWARKSGLIVAAPFVWLPSPPKPKDRHLTKAEAQLLMRACASPHIRLFVLLALCTAGRASALLELEWARVDFVRGLIDLRTAEQNRVKRRAIVPMNDTLRTALEEAHKAAQTRYVIEWAGQRVRSVKRAFARAVAKCGWDDVSPHTLRHTAAVWMAEAGIAMTVIAQYLGHADSRTTERIYARYSPDYLRKASGTLEIGVPGRAIEPATVAQIGNGSRTRLTNGHEMRE